MKNKKMPQTVWTIIAFSLYSTVLISLFTMNTPFFITNTWADANAFLTMGKGIVFGLVPYKDLFEQKGPLLYMIHAFNYLITPDQFWTIALFEIIGLTVSLTYINKIAKLYLTKNLALATTLIFPLFLLPWRIFQTGDSAEEFIIPFIFITLYLIITTIKSNSTFTKKHFFVIGTFVATALWIKYTLLGPWIGFYFAILLYSIYKKEWETLLNAVIYTVLGILTISAPIIIYFIINNAFSDLIEIYFIFNMKSYPAQLSEATKFPLIPKKVYDVLEIIGYHLFLNIPQAILIFLGIFGISANTKLFPLPKEKFFLLSTILFTFLAAYFGGKAYAYYFIIVIPYTIFGIILLFNFLYDKLKIVKPLAHKIPTMLAFSLLVIITPYLIFTENKVIYESKFLNKNVPIQKIYSDIMHQRSDFPTLLNYGVLDLGFYSAADILPSIKYFENQNVDPSVYPGIINGQNNAIANKEIQFVVICHEFDSDVDYRLLNENYTLLDSRQAFGSGPGAWFSLYEVRK
ncbi:MAG: glycosyltransferase family 39 protein [Culicoidibacterales bacterium]